MSSSTDDRDPSAASFPSWMGPPRPRPFDMTEPFLDRGLWCFWLTADERVLQFVSHLHCILAPPSSPFSRRPQGRLLLCINPRYDHEEAWLWIYELLQDETRLVELDDLWINALLDEPEEETGFE